MSFTNWFTDYVPLNRGELVRRIRYDVLIELGPVKAHLSHLERRLHEIETELAELRAQRPEQSPT